MKRKDQTLSDRLPQRLTEGPRSLPVIADVDVFIVGGTTAAVAAALAARRRGASVFLAAPRSYLGEDMCATLRVWLEPQERVRSPLMKSIFRGERTTTPLRIKTELNYRLVSRRIPFLLQSYLTQLLLDSAGEPIGGVISNRSGRQIIRAKTLIDTSRFAVSARLLGRPLSNTENPVKLRRTVIGGRPAAAAEVRQVPTGRTEGESLSYHIYETEQHIDLNDFPGIAAADQEFRARTYRPGQWRGCEYTEFISPACYECGVKTPADAADPAADSFRLGGTGRVWILNPFTGLPPASRQRVLSPANAERYGHRVGLAAAQTAAGSQPSSCRAVPLSSKPPDNITLKEHDCGFPAREHQTVPSDDIPVVSQVDVLVVGGGTAGAAAAIAAGREGKRVLVCEYLEGLGGTGTVGLISRPYHGLSIGFAREVPFCGRQDGTTVDDKMEWLRREVRRGSGTIWLGVIAVEAVRQGPTIRGAVLATPIGRAAVSAEVVIDATGNGDVAAAAGAETIFDGADERRIGVQGSGLALRDLDPYGKNSDFILIDDTNIRDVTRSFAGAMLARRRCQAYDMVTMVQSRERQRIRGDHVLRYIDQIAGRTYADTINISRSDYDSHGYPASAYFGLIPHSKATRYHNHPAPGGVAYTPYRCLLPRGLDGILVVGLATSMERDASALIRMQYDLLNQGYAAGLAAVNAVDAATPPRQINVRRLQTRLVELDILPAEVLEHKNTRPPTARRFSLAVEDISGPDRDRACRALALVFAYPDRSLPLLREAFQQVGAAQREIYAKILGVFGDAAGLPLLLQAAEKPNWGQKVWQGKMAEFAYLPNDIDATVMAIGFAGDSRGVPVLLRRLSMLTPRTGLSHHHALAAGLEQLADKRAARPIAELLAQPGMRGHHQHEITTLPEWPQGRRKRIPALREIVWARALYRCGDYKRTGVSILSRYAEDARGVFRRHARAVLAQ